MSHACPRSRHRILDHDGRGVARVDGKTIFIEGRAAGRAGDVFILQGQAELRVADVVRVLEPSAQPCQPPCPHFGVCGGCSMQHLEPDRPGGGQAAGARERTVASSGGSGRMCSIRPSSALPGAYRYRARLTVRHGAEQGGRADRLSRAAQQLCRAHGRLRNPSAPCLGDGAAPARAWWRACRAPDRLPQIEIAVGEGLTALVFRHLQPITAADEPALAAFAAVEGVQVWLQLSGPDSARRLFPAEAPGLAYTLPEFGVSMAFRPTDFTQVNMDINRLLMRRTMQLLDPRPGERIADLFCGLGNFSLPIAKAWGPMWWVSKAARRWCGVRAKTPADNGLAGRCEFYAANLFEATEDSLAALGPLDKLLIDPPREGALAVVKALGAASAQAASFMCPAIRQRWPATVPC
jgi:23S rRNA (uracil1939-C5)-methyltransferase